LINCDKNTSHASDAYDIFTLARDRGATGALLYATVGEACRINDEYADPALYDRVLDIFATPSKSIVQMILSLMNLGNASYVHYDPESLNSSFKTVESSLTSANMTSSFIIASIRAANSTHLVNGTNSNNGTGAANIDLNSGRSNPNTGLAMIILYAITGCVSGLFIIVILSGAIRAIRHPERYGPRAGGLNARGIRQGAQSTAQGLARAVLDTFPVIKFGQTNPPATGAQENKNDVENPQSLEMSPQNLVDEHQPASPGGSTAGEISNHGEGSSSSSDGRRESHLQGEEGPSLPSPGDRGPPEDVQPSAMGHEICPICIVEFEEGDDVRILPCEGKHRFHKHCVDPWLLELSSSCPLCREDFHALEAMLSGNPEALREDTNHEVSLVGESVPARSSRFARYLRFARRRHVHSEDGEDSNSGNASPPT